MNTTDFTNIHDYTHAPAKAITEFPTVSFVRNDKCYTLTPCRNTHNTKVSYWLSCQGYIIALYAFSVFTPMEAEKMLEDEGTLLSFVSMFEAYEAHTPNKADELKDPADHMKSSPFTFDDGDAMVIAINNIDDFYNPDTETYVFAYNDCGSIAVYTGITPEKATELAKKAKKTNEYWCAFLGAGGEIYDDESYPGYSEGQTSNVDFCEQHRSEGRWFATSDWLNADYRSKEATHE